MFQKKKDFFKDNIHLFLIIFLTTTFLTMNE